MVLLAVPARACMAVLAARPCSPHFPVMTLHILTSHGPAASHAVTAAASVHARSPGILLTDALLLGFAAAFLPCLSGSVGATDKSQIEEWAFAGV